MDAVLVMYLAKPRNRYNDWCPVFVLISGRRAQVHLLAPATSIPFRIEMLNGDTASLVDACEKRPDVPIRPTILFSSFS